MTEPPHGLPTHPPPAHPPPGQDGHGAPGGSGGRRWGRLALVLAVLLAMTAGLLVVRIVDAEVYDAARAGRVGSDRDGAAAANLDEVQVYTPEPGHKLGPIEYEQRPPVGGLHHPVWLECGVYDEPVPDEHVVHDLEHGTVWITYQPGLPADEVEALAELLPANGILSPYEGLRAPVVVTVWGRQLDLTGADDPRLELFIEELGEGVTAPEPFGSCSGGATLDQAEELDRLDTDV